MEMVGMAKREALVRALAMGFLALTASLVRFDTQTKLLFSSVLKKATFKDMKALSTLVYVDFVVASYNLVQLGRCLMHIRFKGNSSYYSSTKIIWGSFLLDQAAAYIVTGATSGAAAASHLAVTGARSFEWMKLCDKFTKFCNQIGGSLLCGYVASLLLAVTSSVTAFNLFSLYSPDRFLVLKART